VALSFLSLPSKNTAKTYLGAGLFFLLSSFFLVEEISAIGQAYVDAGMPAVFSSHFLFFLPDGCREVAAYEEAPHSRPLFPFLLPGSTRKRQVSLGVAPIIPASMPPPSFSPFPLFFFPFFFTACGRSRRSRRFRPFFSLSPLPPLLLWVGCWGRISQSPTVFLSSSLSWLFGFAHIRRATCVSAPFLLPPFSFFFSKYRHRTPIRPPSPSLSPFFPGRGRIHPLAAAPRRSCPPLPSPFFFPFFPFFHDGYKRRNSYS